MLIILAFAVPLFGNSGGMRLLPYIPNEDDLRDYFMIGYVPCRFESPATDYVMTTLDMNQFLVKNKSTFYMVVDGDSMEDESINPEDVIVIDKSLEAENADLVVCAINGEFTLKTYFKHKGQAWLVPANDKLKPLKLTEENLALLWGVVTHVVSQKRKHVRARRLQQLLRKL